MKPQLLCTFAHRKDLDLILDYIVSSYVISEQRLFVFSDENVYNDMYVTFNVDTADTKRIANTILVHRKKETNTMYTVNALNVIIREANNGILDKSFIINWNAYRNSILLTSDDNLRHVRLKMFKRVDL